jgi:hypothetical protein
VCGVCVCVGRGEISVRFVLEIKVMCVDGGQASVGSDAEPDYARGEAQMNSSSDESEFDYEGRCYSMT